MIDNKIDGNERFDNTRILTHSLNGRPHCGKINEKRNARKILEDDSGHDERDFGGALGSGLPARECPNVVLLDAPAVAVAQQGLQDDTDRDGKAPDVPETVLLESGQRVEGPAASGAQRKALPGPLEIDHRTYRITRVASC